MTFASVKLYASSGKTVEHSVQVSLGRVRTVPFATGLAMLANMSRLPLSFSVHENEKCGRHTGRQDSQIQASRQQEYPQGHILTFANDSGAGKYDYAGPKY